MASRGPDTSGPNPKGQSHASHAVPNLHRLPVKPTPKVKATPTKVSQAGPKQGTSRGRSLQGPTSGLQPGRGKAVKATGARLSN